MANNRKDGFYWVLKAPIRWGQKEWIVAHWFNYAPGNDPKGWTIPNSEEYYHDGDFTVILETPLICPEN